MITHRVSVLKKTVLATAILLSGPTIAGPAAAGVQEWTSHGPEGAEPGDLGVRGRSHESEDGLRGHGSRRVQKH